MNYGHEQGTPMWHPCMLVLMTRVKGHEVLFNYLGKRATKVALKKKTHKHMTHFLCNQQN